MRFHVATQYNFSTTQSGLLHIQLYVPKFMVGLLNLLKAPLLLKPSIVLLMDPFKLIVIFYLSLHFFFKINLIFLWLLNFS